MKISLIAVGTKMPAWVETGYNEYAKRLPHPYNLELIEIPLGNRVSKHAVSKAIQDEEKRILAALPKNAHIVALEVKGKQHSTESLSERLVFWEGLGKDIVLLIGGPEGLSEHCRNLADEQWSLSNLTLPHALVRILVAEQLYRAWSVINGHPYHRA